MIFPNQTLIPPFSLPFSLPPPLSSTYRLDRLINSWIPLRPRHNAIPKYTSQPHRSSVNLRVTPLRLQIIRTLVIIMTIFRFQEIITATQGTTQARSVAPVDAIVIRRIGDLAHVVVGLGETAVESHLS